MRKRNKQLKKKACQVVTLFRNPRKESDSILYENALRYTAE